MPWEIPIYICSRFAEALEQIYIPVGLFKQPPPIEFRKRDLCMDIMYTYEYYIYCIHIYILYTRMDIVYTYGYYIYCIHVYIIYIIYTYGYSIKTPPGGFRWKTEKNFE